MSFRLFRDKSNQIIRDAVASSFGFGTKKERMDREIEQYRIIDKNAAEYEMARKNILIANIDATIMSYDQYKKVYDEFLDNFEKLKKEVENLVYKDDSLIEIELKRSDGTFFVKANYATIQVLLKSKKLNPDEVVFLTNELRSKIPQVMKFYALALIKFNGNFNGIVNYDICKYHMILRELLDGGYVKDLNGAPFVFNSGLNKDDVWQAFQFVQKNSMNLSIILNRLDMQKDRLEHLRFSDKRVLETIEQEIELIKTSWEYLIAKSADEFRKR